MAFFHFLPLFCFAVFLYFFFSLVARSLLVLAISVDPARSGCSLLLRAPTPGSDPPDDSAHPVIFRPYTHTRCPLLPAGSRIEFRKQSLRRCTAPVPPRLVLFTLLIRPVAVSDFEPFQFSLPPLSRRRGPTNLSDSRTANQPRHSVRRHSPDWFNLFSVQSSVHFSHLPYIHRRENV